MQEERHGTRDLSYSAWHRAASIRRFVGWERAQLLSMVDADCVLFLEYHHQDKEPLALIEAAIDVGQDYKPATAIARLAKRARIPAYLVLYQRSTVPNPADPRMLDVSGFRIKRLYGQPENIRQRTCVLSRNVQDSECPLLPRARLLRTPLIPQSLSRCLAQASRC